MTPALPAAAAAGTFLVAEAPGAPTAAAEETVEETLGFGGVAAERQMKPAMLAGPSLARPNNSCAQTCVFKL